MSTLENCCYCGKKYRRFRSQGKFCSESCRVQNGKLPVRLKQKADQAIDYIAQMRELAEKYPQMIEDMDTQLIRIQEKLAMVRITIPQIKK